MKLLWVSALSLLTTMSAFAQYYDYGSRGMQGQRERLQLPVHEHLRGHNILKLKQRLKQQYPGIAPRNMELIAVKLVAKSKRGRGQATLLVGQDASYPETIGGTPYDFHDDSRYTFDRIRMQNPAYDSQGKWQIELQGNIKVKKVVLIVKKKMSTQNIRLRTNGQHLRGFNVLPLKRMIKQQNPGIDLQNAKLVRVTMKAKSKMGRGQATLVVGQDTGYPETVPGNPRMFDRPGPHSFAPVNLEVPYYLGDTRGKWQIELQGNIKVQEVIVTIQTNGDNHRNGRRRARRMY